MTYFSRPLSPRFVLVLALLLAAAVFTGAVVGQSGGPDADAEEALALEPAAPTVENEFTYQGQLRQAGDLVDGQCDFRFRLWDAAGGGSKLGSDKNRPAVPVHDGRFSVTLDWSKGHFEGADRWLQVEVKCPAGSADAYTSLGRQRLTAVPYAFNADKLNGYSAAGIGSSHHHAGQDWPSPGSTYGLRVDNSGGYGVYATSSSGRGVVGRGGSGNGDHGGWFKGNTGVYAEGGGAEAVFSNGDMSVFGTLYKTSGAFKIDHPQDPAHKYLAHSFVESPDMMNVYNGNVTLDANGEAWVELPGYFEALNIDYRYQLTAVGAPGPDLYIAAEIAANRFQIAGGLPGAKVSWQVTGIRNDPYARENRIQVVEEKPAAEQGTYLYPELYGQPEEKGYIHLVAAPMMAAPLAEPDEMTRAGR
ncbi:MAG: hypothetical protein R3300_20920 [Candidatus Promineifilaceae bacterium]|nr:hypothetical protein [Candidatus Promineifilaceae bacterium]